MKEDKHELDHLHGCQVFLPPEILLDTRTTGCQEIVEVHHTVDSRVEEGTKATLATAHKAGTPPAEQRQCAMVDDMQGREVAELLAGNKEDGVSQVYELGEVVPPSQI